MDRHLSCLIVPYDLLGKLLRGGFVSDFPEDAKILEVRHQEASQSLLVIAEHPSFRKTPEGSHILTVNLTMHSTPNGGKDAERLDWLDKQSGFQCFGGRRWALNWSSAGGASDVRDAIDSIMESEIK